MPHRLSQSIRGSNRAQTRSQPAGSVGVGTTREEIGEALSAYAARAGDGAMAERFWRLSEAPAAAGS